MDEPTPQKIRSHKPKKKRKPIRVWTPEEFLANTSWYRFGPNSPKRQAHEIIHRLLAEVEKRNCIEGQTNPESWVSKIG